MSTILAVFCMILFVLALFFFLEARRLWHEKKLVEGEKYKAINRACDAEFETVQLEYDLKATEKQVAELRRELAARMPVFVVECNVLKGGQQK